ncbi:MAG TPA: DegT/DnrJ/EryC1/StrS family aminotransferase, partial [candidate division CPR3 bacterium]|nr:DegT/DnrJ/EryC1/StrS family aminotransferase [candidate division CPR3 bacterium]
PVFCDIDEKTLNLDPKEIEKHITKKTKAILAIDIFGHSADWDEILSIAEKYKLKVIEDSAEAVGGEYKGKKCGSFGDASIFSFYPNKQFTTGEGGVVLTDDKNIAELCQSMANQGRKVEGGKWLEHVRLGYNYRLPEIQCAIGLVQLSREKEILQKREEVARLYTEKIRKIKGVEIPFVAPNVKMSWFVYVPRLSKEHTKEQRDKVIAYLENKGIQSRAYFQVLHLQPLYKKMFGYKEGDFPIAEDVSNRTIALPFFTRISEEEIDYVVNTLKEAMDTL